MKSGILPGIKEYSLEEAKEYNMLCGLVAVEVRPHRVKYSGRWLDTHTYSYRMEDCGETGKTMVYPWTMLRGMAFTYDPEYEHEYEDHGHIHVLDESTGPVDYTAVWWESTDEVVKATSLDGLYVHLQPPSGAWKARVKVTPEEMAALVEMQKL